MSESRPPVNPWLIAVVVSMATFMEVLDTSIANVSLDHIAGGMAASLDESTWVLTSYLVSNAIVLPISGWLASVIGRKRFYMLCVALFTGSSLLCGLAPTLPFLILFRVLQGIGGGGLQPSEQSILTDTFPQAKRGQAFALYGVAVVVAPAIGPTLGGWITDNYSWRWIFFINIPVGVLSLVLVHFLLHDSAEAKAERREKLRHGLKVDYLGFGLVAIGLGCLQVVLDKGQEDDWLSSHFILIFAILAVVGIVGAIVWEFITPTPIVDLPLFKNFNFAFNCMAMFAVGFILFGTTQLLPQYTQTLLGYTATEAGLVISPGGFAVMAMMPLVGYLVTHYQPKWLIAFGMFIEGCSLFYMTNFDTQVSFSTLAWARVFQAAGLAFLFVPINTAAYIGLPRGKTNNASALINLARNLGGSFGVSLANTMLIRRTQFHQSRLLSSSNFNSSSYHQTVNSIARTLMHRGVNPIVAADRAVAILYNSVLQQATMLSYLDVFKMLGIAAFLMIGLVVFLKKIQPGEHVQAAH
ncbi:MAG TPA: DHA2 family efflux MFS transporter permease subunit [Tepidisphaeraceae bacterium]|jgi:DHA2 family multidrug resistance protein|nr:DHA2 family efflux MFS transporter permease subunit [Tepidisphaeraceae bacterium]